MLNDNVLPRVHSIVIRRWAFACVTRVSNEEVTSSADTRPGSVSVFELTGVNVGVCISNILGGLDTLWVCVIGHSLLFAACRLSYWLLIHHPCSCSRKYHLLLYWQNKQNWTSTHSNRLMCIKAVWLTHSNQPRSKHLSGSLILTLYLVLKHTWANTHASVSG